MKATVHYYLKKIRDDMSRFNLLESLHNILIDKQNGYLDNLRSVCMNSPRIWDVPWAQMTTLTLHAIDNLQQRDGNGVRIRNQDGNDHLRLLEGDGGEMEITHTCFRLAPAERRLNAVTNLLKECQHPSTSAVLSSSSSRNIFPNFFVFGLQNPLRNVHSCNLVL